MELEDDCNYETEKGKHRTTNIQTLCIACDGGGAFIDFRRQRQHRIRHCRIVLSTATQIKTSGVGKDISFRENPREEEDLLDDGT
jgi:hypothetical protein